MRSQVLRVRRATIDEWPRRSGRAFSRRLTSTLSVSMNCGDAAGGSAGAAGGSEGILGPTAAAIATGGGCTEGDGCCRGWGKGCGAAAGGGRGWN